MGKLITLTDAAKKLGVERQNVEHWVKRGVIKVKKMARKGSGYWVDEATINALLDSAKEVVDAQRWMEEKKEEFKHLNQTLEKRIKDVKRELRMFDSYGRFLCAKHFYESLPSMFLSLGLISEKEEKIMYDIISGKGLGSVAEEYGLSNERINQIFRKAIRKSKDLSELKERMDELDNTRYALKEAQQTIDALTKELKYYMDKESKEIEEQQLMEVVHENSELIRLLNTEIVEFDLSVRTLNCLRYAGIKTLGDLVQYAKTDLLKFRNFGRKSLTEIEDFLEEHNLTFSMDVEKLYNDKVQLLIKEMQG